MSEFNRHYRLSITRRAQRGQTLIVAIAIMFVLLFLGTLFVAQIARNLTTAGRSRESQDARAFADAGIEYCDRQLTGSAEGADWRPTPTAPITSAGDPLGVNDPDYYWLVELGGFTRVPTKGGRALVRVLYEPSPNDPRGQLIRIEAVGRTGEVSPLDPTVFADPQSGVAPRARKELIAYKQIGLTDYVRFITNKNKTNVENSLGTPPIARHVAAVFNDPSVALNNGADRNSYMQIGGGIRINGNLRIPGDFFAYFSSRGGPAEFSPEGLLVSGTITTEPTRDVNGDGVIDARDVQAFVNQDLTANIDVNNPNNLGQAIFPSSDAANFNTIRALVRDGASTPDRFGYNRSIPNLDPPIMDGLASGSNIMRYRELTRESGRWITVNGKSYNTGFDGWGRGVYVNNPDDAQRETARAGVLGSYSLRADWLNPNNQFAQSYWQGPFYRPPGILVELRGDRILLTRSDDGTFKNPDGSSATNQGGKVIEIPLSHFDRDNFTLPDGTPFRLERLDTDGDEPNVPGKPFRDSNSYGVNLVLMAEGNVRVKGVLGTLTNPNDGLPAERKLSRVHLTIVSNATAYIEGNIVKGDGVVVNGAVTPERGSTCAILAKDYVCVNTTMFQGPQNQTGVWSRSQEDTDAFYMELGQSRSTFDMAFNHGVDPSTYGTPLYLLLRHAAMSPGPSFINLMINPALSSLNNPQYSGLYLFNPVNNIGLPRETYILGLKYPVGGGIPASDSKQVTPSFEHKAFQLALTPDANSPYVMTPRAGGELPGYDNYLRFQADQTATGLAQIGGYNLGSGGSTEYLLGGAAVVPLDIRIEATLYAQEKSFFVIPGYPFNADPGDSRPAFGARGTRLSYSDADTPQDKAAKDVFPFHNDPLDVRITFFGAISENYTASSSDQAAWMSRWGFIPATYGSSGQSIPADHLTGRDPAGYMPASDRNTDFRTPEEKRNDTDAYPVARGIRYLYDPALALPYYNPTEATVRNMGPIAHGQRALRFTRRTLVNYQGQALAPEIRQILPAIPRLPVCPGLLYVGDGEERIRTSILR